MILKNVKHEPGVSKPTLRPSLRRPTGPAVSAPTVANSLFKSRVLNPVHLNQVLKNNNDNKSSNEEEDNGFQEAKEDAASNTWKSAEKYRLKKNKYEYQYQNNTHHHYYHHAAQQKRYQHKRGSEPQSPKDNEIINVATDSQTSSQAELSNSDDITHPRKIKIKVSEVHCFPANTH